VVPSTFKGNKKNPDPVFDDRVRSIEALIRQSRLFALQPFSQTVAVFSIQATCRRYPMNLAGELLIYPLKS
jgi:hypothetical protein